MTKKSTDPVCYVCREPLMPNEPERIEKATGLKHECPALARDNDSGGRSDSTFRMIEYNGRPGIKCLRCGRVSFSGDDIKHRYCGECKMDHQAVRYLECSQPWCSTKMPVKVEGEDITDKDIEGLKHRQQERLQRIFSSLPEPEPKPEPPPPDEPERQPTFTYPPPHDGPPVARGKPDTSVEAADSIRPMIRGLTLLVFKTIKERGTHGATCYELEVDEEYGGLGLRHQTASSRLTELKRMEWIKDSGERRPAIHPVFPDKGSKRNQRVMVAHDIEEDSDNED